MELSEYLRLPTHIRFKMWRLPLLFGLFTNKLAGIAATVVMLFLMVLLVVFARGVATLARTSLKLPALFFMWAAMILTIGCVALAASGAFFNWPLARRELLSMRIPWLGLAPPPLLPTKELPFRDERVQLNRLLPGMLEALDNGVSEDETLRSLAEKGSLRLNYLQDTSRTSSGLSGSVAFARP